jgi:hypothetical protein
VSEPWGRVRHSCVDSTTGLTDSGAARAFLAAYEAVCVTRPDCQVLPPDKQTPFPPFVGGS